MRGLSYTNPNRTVAKKRKKSLMSHAPLIPGYTPMMHLKKRSLKLILDKIQEIQTIQLHHYKTKWKPWYAKAKKVGQFWGYEREKKTLFTFDQDGYTHHAPDNKAEALCCPDNDLPLMIPDPYWKDCLDVIEGRLKGTLKAIPHRQDLINEYHHIDWKDTRRYRVLGAYKNLLYRLIQDRYGDQLYSRFTPAKLIILHHSNRNFYLIRSHGSLELLDKEDLISHTVTDEASCGTDRTSVPLNWFPPKE